MILYRYCFSHPRKRVERPYTEIVTNRTNQDHLTITPKNKFKLYFSIACKALIEDNLRHHGQEKPS